MGYLQTVLGYTKDGKNHGLSEKDFFRLIAKKMLFNGSPVDLTSDEELDRIVEKLKDANNTYDVDADVEIELHDDLEIVERCIDGGKVKDGKLVFESYERYFELMGCGTPLCYKKCPDIYVGTTCCFEGIIVNISGCDEEDYKTSLEKRLVLTEAWIEELRKTSRISGDWKLVMVSNCCS